MALKNKNNLFYNTSYTGKPAKKFYSFKENQLTFITIKYTNEGRNSLSLRPRVLKFTHNASHVTGITYEYLNRPPSPSHVVKLKEVVKKYVDDHPEYDSFYKMIELPDYNQALYYACIKSKIELVQLLIDHNTYNELHLDFNQPSPNGTLLDQVEHAHSTELSLLLQSQGAMTTESLLSLIVEPEHQDKHVSTASSPLAQVDAVGHQEKNHLSENTPPRAVYFFRRPLPTHLPPLDNTHSSSSPTPAVPRSPL